ncbi:MAG: hypothetical protein AAB726_03625, partial [Patescibacteria group bacterium]
GNGVSFISQDGKQVQIFIRKSCFFDSGDTSFGCLVRTIGVLGNPIQGDPVALTSPEVRLERVEFFISGTDPPAPSAPIPGSDADQPKVSIFLKGTVNAGPRNQTSFSLQTAVSQRIPDL